MEWLIGTIFIAIPIGIIADSKGRSFWLWYFYGVLLWFVAFIHVFFIRTTDEQLISDGVKKKCINCDQVINIEALICYRCSNKATK